MAVMARHVNVAFEVAPEKTELFKKMFSNPKGKRGSDRVLARAAKFADLSKIQTVRPKQNHEFD